MKYCVRITCLVMALLFVGLIPLQTRADILVLPDDPTMELVGEPSYIGSGEEMPEPATDPEPGPIPDNAWMIRNVSLWIIALITATLAILILIKRK